MANGHGGYRRPEHPAPVSGPGKLSRRTDGRQPQMIASGGDYGDRQEMQQIQSGAPMNGDLGSGGMSAQPGAATGGMPDLSQLVPLDADSQRPAEDIMAGMSGGAGAGPSVLNMPSPLTDEQRARLRHFLPVLVILASRDDADQNTRRLVRQLRAELG
jgi:hypothetical protein